MEWPADHDRVLDAAIAEIQLARDDDKHASWLQYTAMMYRKLCVPVTVMVLAVNEDVERWCTRTLEYDRAGNVFKPLVIGPSKIPWIRDLEQAEAFPELALLSVAAHGTRSRAPRSSASPPPSHAPRWIHPGPPSIWMLS